MPLTELRPMLETNDLEATIDFYTSTLGFENVNQLEGWVQLEKDDVTLMFTSRLEEDKYPDTVMTGGLYFYTDEVDQLWETWKEAAEIAYPIETFEYGVREFAILDNNGYRLQFGQEME